LSWRKSSYSGGSGGECVEVAQLPEGARAMRDTKDHGHGPALLFPASEWAAFTAAVRAGGFGCP
jgi:hypothetical protein